MILKIFRGGETFLYATYYRCMYMCILAIEFWPSTDNRQTKDPLIYAKIRILY